MGNDKPTANMRNHDIGNLVFEKGHELPTISSHRLCYQHFTVKPSLGRINTPNTKRSEILETKLRIVDLFNNTYENNCQPNRGLLKNTKYTILKNERNIE